MSSKLYFLYVGLTALWGMKMNRRDLNSLRENMIFVGTIYDSFEALEETLGKLKLERPLFITHVAKLAFAEEVFKYAYENKIYVSDEQSKTENKPVVFN